MRLGRLANCGLALFLSTQTPSASAATPVPPTPIGNPGEWANAEDYPARALRDDKEGVTQFVLTIDPTGKVIGCLITSQSGSFELDEATCRLMTERGRFTPAKNEKGRAVQGSWTNFVRWVLPKDLPQPAPGTVVFSSIIEKDGSYSDCRIVRADPGLVDAPPVGPIPCSKHFIDPPFTNTTGEPVRKRISQTITISLEDVTD